jgi:hypothetical protein
MEEIWRPSLGELLEVSNLGRVRSKDRVCFVPRRIRDGKVQAPTYQRRKGKLLSPFISGNGYPTIAVKTGATRKKWLVHRLIAEAFVLGQFEGATVDHIDGNKENNRADNLRWVTRAENTRHQWLNGLVDLRGDAHPSSKLTREQAAAVKLLADNGFPAALIGEWFGVKRDTVYAIRVGERWKQVLGER